jgi:hypothetical protein
MVVNQTETLMKLLSTFLLIPALLLAPSAAQSQDLVNPNATAEAKKLKHLLDSVYGKKIISGQMDDKYLKYIEDATGGKAPAMMGYDFNGICPSQGGNVDAAKAIDWVKNKGGIAQFQWHWISPNADGDFYTKNFKLDQALADENSDSYKNMLRDIDLVAGELKKLQDAGVPILWRPLHEAEGKWFWWGMAGGDACKKLYRLMYDRYVNHFGLNNLIWVWNSYGTEKENWYPGDDVVDIIAWDYPNYTQTSSWKQYQQLFDGKGKLYAVGEDSKLLNPDIITTQPWLYFLTWAYMIENENAKEWINQVYNDPRIITLDDLIPGPKAKAGQPQLLFDLDDDGIEAVTLDGSKSYTNEGTITSYTWTKNGVEIATGVSPTVVLPVGLHVITLTVTTSTQETKSGNVTITIKKPSLSLNKPYTVSSTEANLGNVAENAVDGDEATRWSSLYADPQWYVVDLGEEYDIEEVVISWEVASAKDYSIEVSTNKVTWTPLVTKTNMASGARIDKLTDLAGSGRYVRIYGTARNTQYGYSIYEFEVYGSKKNITSIEERTNSGFNVYPSPVAKGRIITVEVSGSGKSYELYLYSADGKLIFRKESSLPKQTMNAMYPAGTYLMILNGDRKQCRRIIVE